MMWRKGRKNDNISPLIRIKKIIHVGGRVDFTAAKFVPELIDYKVEANKLVNLLGNDQENYIDYENLADYKKCLLLRMSTRLDNFQVHRIVGTTIGTGVKAVYHEDKITFTDPIMYFYRDTTGDGYPGAIVNNANGDFIELMKKKCIRGCKDGWYWTTRFPTKTERKFVPANTLRSLMQNRTGGKDAFLTTMGVISRSSNGSVADQHSMNFVIARQTPYGKDWYKDKMGQDSIVRQVADHITFDMTTYITVRGFDHVE